jgi:hypothetical protein
MVKFVESLQSTDTLLIQQQFSNIYNCYERSLLEKELLVMSQVQVTLIDLLHICIDLSDEMASGNDVKQVCQSVLIKIHYPPGFKRPIASACGDRYYNTLQNSTATPRQWTIVGSAPADYAFYHFENTDKTGFVTSTIGNIIIS